MTKPLAGIKVVELAEQGFVPSAGAVLTDWGAEVVKVERPDGDGLRKVMASGLVASTGDFDYLWEQMNRGKRGVCIDLKAEGGRDALLRLVAVADVFLTNQLPQVRRKFAIEPDDLFGVNSRLVYARGHGQGTKGPDAEAGGYDAVSYFSRSGIAHMLAPAGGPLVMQRPAMGDAPSGMMLAGAIAAGLLHRERTGEGVVVDLSLFAAGLWTLSPDLVATSVLGHEPPKFSMGALPNPLIGPYLTGDGRYLMLNMLQPDKYWLAACRALELDDLASDDALAGEAARAERSDELRERFIAQLATKPLAHWVARLAESGCVFSTMANPPEVLADPQVTANGYMPAHLTHATARLVANPAQFDEEPVVPSRVAPECGQHTDEVLSEAGIGVDEIAALRARRPRSPDRLVSTPELVSPGAQVGWLAGAHLPAEAYWVSKRPVAIVGMAYPSRIRWDELANEGVGRVVCLVDDEPAYDPTPLALTAVRLQDLYTSPNGPVDPEREHELVRRAAAAMVADVRSGIGVAVHCRGGRGRTGTVIGVALVRLGLDADTVVSWLQRLHRNRGRQGWPESAWQEGVVRGESV